MINGKLMTFSNIIWVLVCCQDGVVFGVDTRATEGPIVADMSCEKTHYMSPNRYCCGAGTAADTEAVTGILIIPNLFLALAPSSLTTR